jgi:hypothetical protein
MASQPFGEI